MIKQGYDIKQVNITMIIPKPTSYNTLKPFLKTIESMITKETNVKPKIELVGVKSD